MKRCGILCYFSDEFYKKFKRSSVYYYRFKEDLIHIVRELIYSGCFIFSVGGTSEAYQDFMEEFFKSCSIIGRVHIEVVNQNYYEYLINECDQIFVFWKDDKNWDSLLQKIEQTGKEVDLYDMDSVTDEYRRTDKYLQQIAEDDNRAVKGIDIDYLLRYNANYTIKKSK